DNKDGTLTVTKSDNAEALDFVNKYAAEGSVTFAGTKSIDTRDLTDKDVFTFSIEGSDGYTKTVKNDETGKIAYPVITYTLDDAGTITYTVKETSKDGNGITVATNTYEVTVYVKDNKDGTLKITKSDNADKLDFVNKERFGEKTEYGIVKVSKAGNEPDHQLDGAEFTLYNHEACKDTNKIKEYSGRMFVIDTEDPELEDYLPADESTTTTLYLKETKAPDGYVLDETVHEISITMDISDPEYDADENAFITTTTYSITIDGKEAITIINKKTEVKVSKVDVADGKELEGATIQILDKDGTVVAEWTSGTEPYVVTGLKTGEKYTLKETVAPDGYTITAETHFIIDETGNVTSDDTTIDEEGVLLVEDRITSVKVSKVDFEDGTALEGATIQILDDAGTVVAEWISGTEAHEVKGLKTGVQYTIRETVAPDGYTLTYDTHFIIDEYGKVSTDGPVGRAKKNGILMASDSEDEDVLLVRNAKAPSFEKKIADVNDSIEKLPDDISEIATGKWQDSADYDIGDKVPYRLTAKLASNVTEYKAYHITFHDTLDKEGSLDFNGIQKVLVNSKEVTNYEPTVAGDKHSFELKMAWGEGADSPIDDSLNNAVIEVYFTATLNEHAVLGNEGNINTCYLEYSNNPQVDDQGKPSEDTDKTKEDSVIAFTYKVVVNKVDEDGKALEGAEFTLEKVLADKSRKQIGDDRITIDGNVFTFKGLDDGTYVLTETKHPDGYKGVEPITFEVIAKHNNTWEGEERTTILETLTGGNVKEGELPATEITFVPDRDKGSLEAEVKNKKNEEFTCAIVKKVWDDDNDRDCLRPEGIEVKLLANGEDVKTYELNAGNNWMMRVDDLPKTKDGEPITYTWEEVTECKDYDKPIIGGTAVLTTLTNRHAPDRTVLRVRKAWNDSENKAGKRPDGPIIAQIFADGVAVAEVELNESNGWSDSWTGPKYTKDADGKKHTIVYTVVEMDVPDGYVCTITKETKAFETEFVITNTFETGSLIIEKEFDIREPEDEPEDEEMTTEIQIVKIWVDNDNKDGNRPEKITIHLYAGGEEVKTTELNASNGWKRTFSDLPKFVDGHPIKYSVTEDPVKWYTSEVRGFTITNRYQPEEVSVSIRKVWDDSGNEKHRPESVRMNLNNGMYVVLSEKNGWSGVITGLPKYVNGEEAVYTWSEPEVFGYQIKSAEVDGSLTVITNEPYHDDGTTKGKKPPKAGPGTEEIDEYKTPLGVNVIINHVGDCFD
ncbi:MAG: Cna B-type domain-containing protein, partial [Clostridia bacterium]|nr:Cna B-type domain-containing protein [Clostridia bacterium]